jgi:hypothetical protein
MTSWSVIGCVFLALFTAGARADEAEAVGFGKADTRTKFALVAQAVREGMARDGRYRFVTAADRSTVDDLLARMQTVFEHQETTSAMSDADRLVLFNSQERINGILTRNDAERLVCSSERPIGSNIPVRICKTYGLVRQNQEDAQRYRRTRDANLCQGEGPVCRVEHM